ncbi:hypothetical protein N431DRAFT_46069 [Stipitochalara longipes BDJ]|nr:hypothetical protein N431DRAFT_46069 [Stipitochalara longipes BDJ]
METSLTPPLPPRRHDLDNLRTFLVAFVVFHHTSIAYGGHGNWPFHSSCFSSDATPIILPFEAVAQSCGMGLFFWISGRMSAHSLSHSTVSKFVNKKLIRLFIPAVFYTVFLNPLVWAWTLERWDWATARGDLLQYWMDIRGVRGVVWYNAVLLTFDCIVALFVSIFRCRRVVLKDAAERETKWDALVYRGLSTYGWLLVAISCFFIRLYYPVGTTIEPLSVQPAYVSQYIFAYTLGYLSVQQGEERFTGPFDRPIEKVTTPLLDTETEGNGDSDSKRAALPLRRALAISFLTLPLCAIIPKLWARYSGQPIKLADETGKGGWNASALTYAFWNEFSFIVLGPSVMYHFSRFHNNPAKSWLWQPRFSYAAYLLHTLLSVGVEVLVDGLLCRGGQGVCASQVWWWRLFVGPLFFTLIVGCLNSSLTFAGARGLVGYVPGMKRIL